MSDEDLAKQALDEQAKMLEKAFGLEDDVLDISKDLAYTKECIERALGADFIITDHQMNYPEGGPVVTEETSVFSLDDLAQAYKEMTSQRIVPRKMVMHSTPLGSLSKLFSEAVAEMMNKPSLARRILPPVKEK